MFSNFFKKNTELFYIGIVYVLILVQYPVSMAISRLALHQDLATSIQPNYLLLWGLVRILLVIPLLLALILRGGVKGEEIYFSFGNYKKVIAITFWGTFAFTFIGIVLYPWLIRTTSLNVLTFFEYLPIFLLYAVTNAFIEETFFRGIALHFITEKTRFWIANLVQAFFFALIHIINPMTSSPWAFVLATFLLGILWGLLTKRTKSLLPAIAIHVMADIFVAISLF
jgi:membrane protease YdiL (CAAX protease family)